MEKIDKPMQSIAPWKMLYVHGISRAYLVLCRIVLGNRKFKRNNLYECKNSSEPYKSKAQDSKTNVSQTFTWK